MTHDLKSSDFLVKKVFLLSSNEAFFIKFLLCSLEDSSIFRHLMFLIFVFAFNLINIAKHVCLKYLFDCFTFLGGGTTFLCHFFCLFVTLCVVQHISGTVHHLIIILVHICKMMICPGVCFIFLKF